MADSAIVLQFVVNVAFVFGFWFFLRRGVRHMRDVVRDGAGVHSCCGCGSPMVEVVCSDGFCGHREWRCVQADCGFVT
jgi:hypothetical protein